MCWVAKGYVQVHRSLKSDRFAGRGSRPRNNGETNAGRRSDGRFSTGAGPTGDAFELAQGAVQRLGFSQCAPADPDRRHCGGRGYGGGPKNPWKEAGKAPAPPPTGTPPPPPPAAPP